MNKKYWIIFSLIVLVMLIGGLIGKSAAYFSDNEKVDSNVVTVRSDWYDVHWKWRKPVTITNSAANYQLKLTVDTKTLIDDLKMDASGNDIRFTAADGITLLNYWIESTNLDTTTATIWVNLGSTAPATIYMYYNYSDATAVSNGDNTFIFFDDFEDNVDSWTEINGNRGVISRVSTTSAHGSWSMLVDDNTTNTTTYGTYATIIAQTSCVIEYYIQPTVTDRIWEPSIRSTTTLGPHLRFETDASLEYIDTDANGTDFSPAVSYSANIWYEITLDEIRVDNDTYDIYVNGNLKKNNTAFDNVVGSLNRIAFQNVTNNNTSDIYVDLVKVRAYSASAVSGTFQAEE